MPRSTRNAAKTLASDASLIVKDEVKTEVKPEIKISETANQAVKLPSFVPVCVPTVIVDDTFMLTMRNRRVTAAVDAETMETVSTVDRSGLLAHNIQAVSLTATMKKSEQLFTKAMLKYSPYQLVRLGMIHPEQMADFEEWQASEIACKEAMKEAKATKPKPILTAQEQAEKEKTRLQRKAEKIATAKELAQKMRQR